MRFIALLAFAVACSGDDTILPPDSDDDEDEECPDMEHIPVTSPQIIGTDVGVTVSITDDSGVLSAILYYKRETSITWDDVGPNNDPGGSGTYEFTIPGKAVDGAAGMHYYIWAQDDSPNLNDCTLPNDGEEGPFHFTIDSAKKD
jgi:hypothetical protein